MNRLMGLRVVIHFWVIALWCTVAFGQDPTVIADFESGRSVNIGANRASASIILAKAAATDSNFLRIEPTAKSGYVRLGLPGSVSFVDREQLSASLRVSAKARVSLTWIALNEKREPIFLRTVKVEPGDQWTTLEVPLRLWRWPEARVGDWDEVKGLALRIDSAGVEHVDVDDIRLERAAPAGERTDWLLDLAFEKRDRRTAQRGDFLVATDATDAFRDQDLQQLLDDVTAARTFIRRAFGDAVRPTEEVRSPAMLLIFSTNDARHAFLKRLGDEWGATINIGRAQGFTVHDIATATYDQRLGVRRPVYLHEAVHAIVSRDLRVMPGQLQQGLLQEAIANYVQISVHPKSIAPDAYPKAFARPIDGNGIFKPLETLLSNPTTSKEYAQLASLCAYLVEEDPTLLRELASALADGGTVKDALEKRRTSFQKLQQAWLAWGREQFKTAPAPGDPIFERPVEFR